MLKTRCFNLSKKLYAGTVRDVFASLLIGRASRFRRKVFSFPPTAESNGSSTKISNHQWVQRALSTFSRHPTSTIVDIQDLPLNQPIAKFAFLSIVEGRKESGSLPKGK